MDLANNGGGSFGTCGGEDGAPSWEWGMLGEDNRTILGDTPDGVPPVDSDEPQDDAGDGEGVGISHPH